MRRSNDHALFRTIITALAFAGLAACSGPDPTKFSCTSSAECPSGYHCDLGTATTAGSLKCASGAPQQKTITVDANKFLLSKQPSPDGSTRTTISADLGAVTSTPDFVGVRVIASQGGQDIANSLVLADGSVLEFQLPQATAQVALRVQDDSGHSVTVTGYRQQVELSFVGKDVSGNTNANTAYDVTTSSDSLYAPATWIASGPGPGGAATELAVSDTLLADGGIQSSASYASIAYLDYHNAATSTPAQLTDPSGASVGGNVGWQEFSQIATTDLPDGGPSARVAATMSNVSGMMLYGGTDLTGTLADPAGSWWKFDSFQGWTQVIPPAGVNALPSGGAKAGVALGYGGSNGCPSYPCNQFNFQFSMAGGLTGVTTTTNRVVAYGTQSSIQTSGSTPVVTATGWFDVGTLPFANGGMASAPAQIPISSNSTGGFEYFAGMMMLGGQNIISGGVGVNSNDQNGCMLYAGYPFGSTSPVANKTFSCTDTNFTTTTGEIGFRTGATLVPLDSQTFLLFGGNKTGGTGSFPNGFKNDLWKGVLACNGTTTCATQVTWSKIVPSSGVVPPVRANAGGAVWQTTLTFVPTFTIKRRVAIYGGSDASGNTLNDFWEFDVNDNVWRQVPFDGGSALAPAARTRFAMAGDGGHAYIFGGVVSGTASDQMWLTTREGPARLLMKAPFSLPAVDQATNSTITVDAPGLISAQAFLWDGTRWRFIGTSAFQGGGYHLLATPTAPATGFLQSDGNIYLLLIGSGHASPTFGGSPLSTDTVKMTVDFK